MRALHAMFAAALAMAACGSSNNTSTGDDSGGAVDACVPGDNPCANPCTSGNEKGVGRYCTAGGGECGDNTAPFIFCTKDYEPDEDVSYCTGPCSVDADCGPDAKCSGSGMGSMGCEPIACSE